MSTVLDYLQAIVDLGFDRSPWPMNVTLLALVCSFLILILALYDTRILAPISLACYTAPLINPTFVSFPDLRVPALLLAFYLALLRRKLPHISLLRRGMYPASFVYLFLGIALLSGSVDGGNSLAKGGSTLLAITYTWLLIGAAEPDELRRTIRGVASVLVLVSIALVVVDPARAIEGDRWRGILENANSLGIAAGFYFLSARPRSIKSSFLALAAVVLGTASRATAFGVGLVAGPQFLHGQSRVVRRTVAAIAILCAIPLLHSVFYSQSDSTSKNALARTENSRADFWGDAIDQIKERPVTGRGVGNETVLVPSSVLRPMVEVGIPALIPVAMTVGVCFKVLRSRRGQMRSIFLFLFVNGIFEGWLFAGGSLFYVVFLLSAAVAMEPEPPADVTAPTTADESMAALL